MHPNFENDLKKLHKNIQLGEFLQSKKKKHILQDLIDCQLEKNQSLSIGNQIATLFHCLNQLL